MDHYKTAQTDKILGQDRAARFGDTSLNSPLGWKNFRKMCVLVEQSINCRVKCGNVLNRCTECLVAPAIRVPVSCMASSLSTPRLGQELMAHDARVGFRGFNRP